MKKIYLVGGAVRDKLLGLKEPSDADFVAVGYTESDFSHLKKVGKSFAVFLDENGCEIALARREKKVGAGYNGFTCETKEVSLEDDLKRRDLTINSMAQDPQSGEIIDPYGGRADLEKKILRHTSEAFSEDPLRVLRLARFRAKFGAEWKIAAQTKVLCYKMRQSLKELEPNRVFKEVWRVLENQNSYLFFDTLFELGVLGEIFPNIYELTTLKEGNRWHLEGSVFMHTMWVLRLLDKEAPTLKAAALYHDIAKPYTYREFGNSAGHDRRDLVEKRIELNLPKQQLRDILLLIENHIKIGHLPKMRPSRVVEFFSQYQKKELLAWQFALYRADFLGREILQSAKNSDEYFTFSENLEAKYYELWEILAKYSPAEWIFSQENKPSAEQIKEKIAQEKSKIVKNFSLNLPS